MVGSHRLLNTILGKLCIEVTPTDKIAYISEDLCIGCGICAKVSANYCVFKVKTVRLMLQTVDNDKEISLNVGFVYRNARLRPYPSLIFPVIWKKIQPTDIAQTRSNFIGKRLDTF